MIGRTFGALALCTIGLAGCMEGGTQTEAELLQYGWKPVSEAIDGSSATYAQRSPESGKKYWVLTKTNTAEMLTKYEFDCGNQRFRELVPTSDRNSGVSLELNPDWQSVLDFLPQSMMPILQSDVCSGLI